MSLPMVKTKDDKLDLYLFWGVEFSSQNNGEMIASCPFCHETISERRNYPRFYVNVTTGAFSCKVCGKEGGQRDFLEYTFNSLLEKTTEQQLRQFMILTGIPLPAFRGKIAYAGLDRYVIPAYDEFNKVSDLRTFEPGKKERSTKNAPSPGLVGVKELLNGDPTVPVYLTEGFRDKLALDWLLWRNSEPGITVAVPGANIFKKDWTKLFTGRDVVICFDHDLAGYGAIDALTNKCTGSRKVQELLKPYVSSLQFVCWPDQYKSGYDIRNLIIDGKEKPKHTLARLKGFIKKHHKYDLLKAETKNENNIQLEEIFKKCGEIFELVPDFINSVKLTLALIFANKIPGKDKPWLFLIGPPSSGKTIALEQVKEARNHVIYESRLTRTALVSGWNLGTNQADTSIMARIGGKLLGLKDATELLELNKKERDEVFSLLRGAFDGSVSYHFGNGTRRYPNTLFTCIMGVTHAIQAYNMASLGERFLRYKYESVVDEDTLMETASTSRLFGNAHQKDLQALFVKFCDNNYDFSPESLRNKEPEWFRLKLKPLAKLIAWLRTNVDRHDRGIRMGEIRYEPVREVASRIHNQLEAIALSLAVIEEKDEIDDAIYLLLKRIAKDSIPDYALRIVKTMIEIDKPMNLSDIGRFTGIRDIGNEMDDLLVLKVVKYNPEKRLVINHEVKELWELI